MNTVQKTLWIISIASLMIVSLIVTHRTKKNKNAKMIGILQTASHPALDAARQGLIDELNKTLGTKIEYSLHNAQGSIANAQAIAQQLHSNPHVAAIYAIATPALQAAASVETQKPIIITAVTDPADLGIMHEKTNVCGVSDMIDMKKEIEMLVALLPEVKTVGLLYSTGELNSLKQVAQIKHELAQRNIQYLDASVTQESDVPAAVSMVCRNADALLVPTDNIMASAMDLIASLALQHKKPLLACYNQAVTQGALASRGVDYYGTGTQAAHVAYQILIEGKKPYQMPIIKPNSDMIYINKKTLEALGLQIPAKLANTIIIID
jgi:putative ABC transport system substrate-binding protein